MRVKMYALWGKRSDECGPLFFVPGFTVRHFRYRLHKCGYAGLFSY